jgi:hypothetical protein
MKKLVLLLSVIVLTGCATSVPVVAKWPDVPKELLESCPDLKTVEPQNDKLSAIVDTVADNYNEYYKCKDKVNDWAVWYKGQQELWKTLK